MSDEAHRVQEWLQTGPCFILTPGSYSRRILEEDEATTLLSAAAVALSHLSLTSWPLLLPFSDALRDAYKGIAIVPSSVSSVISSSIVSSSSDTEKDEEIDTNKVHVVEYSSDSVHGSRIPGHLTLIEEQLKLFSQRLRRYSPSSSGALLRGVVDSEEDCGVAVAVMEASPSKLKLKEESSSNSSSELPGVSIWVKNCYQLEIGNNGNGDVDEKGGKEGKTSSSSLSDDDDGGGGGGGGGWDFEAPWRPWATETDLIGPIEAEILWKYNNNTSHLAIAADSQPDDFSQAALWRVAVTSPGSSSRLPDDGKRGFLLRAVDNRRQFMKLPLHALAELSRSSFYYMLRNAIKQYYSIIISSSRVNTEEEEEEENDKSSSGGGDSVLLHSVGQLASEAWWVDRIHLYYDTHMSIKDNDNNSDDDEQEMTMKIPQAPEDWMLQDALRDVFQAPALPLMGTGGRDKVSYLVEAASVEIKEMNDPTSSSTGNSTKATRDGDIIGKNINMVGKAAPLTSLITRLALHALVLGNARAVALLWAKFLRDVRFMHWENKVPLPRMLMKTKSVSDDGGGGGGGVVDTRCCLIHQKLQLLQHCIASINSNNKNNNNDIEEDGNNFHSAEEEEEEEEEEDRVSIETGMRSPLSPRGVATVLPDTYILSSQSSSNPAVPLRVPLTQAVPPMTEDQLVEKATAVQAADTEQRLRLSGPLLFSDMEAFKAANPGGGGHIVEFADFVRWHSPKDWDENKNSLSSRMKEPGNTWHHLWSKAKAVPVSRQKPLFDAEKEGELALHFLETIPPAVLFGELITLGFSAGGLLLSRAPAAGDGGSDNDDKGLPAVVPHMQSLLRDIQTTLVTGISFTPSHVSDSISSPSSPVYEVYNSGVGRERLGDLVKKMGRAECIITAAQSMLLKLESKRDGSGGDYDNDDEDRRLLDIAARNLANRLIASSIATATDTASFGSAMNTCVVEAESEEEKKLIQILLKDQPYCRMWRIDVMDEGGKRHVMCTKSLPYELRVSTSVMKC